MRRVLPLLLVLSRPVLADDVSGTPGGPVARLAALWLERRDPSKAQEALQLATTALAEKPDAPDRMFWKARLALWVGDNLTELGERKRLGREAWEIGDRLARARPNWVAGHYFGAVGIGLYCSGAGILHALGEGLDGKFNERLERALALDPRFEHEGPRLAKGRYFFEMPWPKRSLSRSAAWFRQVLDDDPRNIRAMAWLAETLWKDGDAAGARGQLARALEGHIEGDLPEEERVKEIAQRIARDLGATGAR